MSTFKESFFSKFKLKKKKSATYELTKKSPSVIHLFKSAFKCMLNQEEADDTAYLPHESEDKLTNEAQFSSSRSEEEYSSVGHFISYRVKNVNESVEDFQNDSKKSSKRKIYPEETSAKKSHKPSNKILVEIRVNPNLDDKLSMSGTQKEMYKEIKSSLDKVRHMIVKFSSDKYKQLIEDLASQNDLEAQTSRTDSGDVLSSADDSSSYENLPSKEGTGSCTSAVSSLKDVSASASEIHQIAETMKKLSDKEKLVKDLEIVMGKLFKEYSISDVEPNKVIRSLIKYKGDEQDVGIKTSSYFEKELTVVDFESTTKNLSPSVSESRSVVSETNKNVLSATEYAYDSTPTAETIVKKPKILKRRRRAPENIVTTSTSDTIPERLNKLEEDEDISEEKEVSKSTFLSKIAYCGSANKQNSNGEGRDEFRVTTESSAVSAPPDFVAMSSQCCDESVECRPEHSEFVEEFGNKNTTTFVVNRVEQASSTNDLQGVSEFRQSSSTIKCAKVYSDKQLQKNVDNISTSTSATELTINNSGKNMDKYQRKVECILEEIEKHDEGGEDGEDSGWYTVESAQKVDASFKANSNDEDARTHKLIKRHVTIKEDIDTRDDDGKITEGRIKAGCSNDSEMRNSTSWEEVTTSEEKCSVMTTDDPSTNKNSSSWEEVSTMEDKSIEGKTTTNTNSFPIINMASRMKIEIPTKASKGIQSFESNISNKVTAECSDKSDKIKLTFTLPLSGLVSGNLNLNDVEIVPKQETKTDSKSPKLARLNSSAIPIKETKSAATLVTQSKPILVEKDTQVYFKRNKSNKKLTLKSLQSEKRYKIESEISNVLVNKESVTSITTYESRKSQSGLRSTKAYSAFPNYFSLLNQQLLNHFILTQSLHSVIFKTSTTNQGVQVSNVESFEDTTHCDVSTVTSLTLLRDEDGPLFYASLAHKRHSTDNNDRSSKAICATNSFGCQTTPLNFIAIPGKTKEVLDTSYQSASNLCLFYSLRKRSHHQSSNMDYAVDSIPEKDSNQSSLSSGNTPNLYSFNL